MFIDRLNRNQKILAASLLLLLILGSLVGAYFVARSNVNTTNGGPGASQFVSPGSDTPSQDTIVSLAAENQTEDVPDESDEDSVCTLQPAGPILDDNAYVGYKLARSTASVEESVNLDNQTKLRVTTAGCEGIATTEFSFQVPKSLVAGKTPAEKLKWVREKITQLNFKSGDYDSEKAARMLSKFSELKPDPENPALWVICNDRTLPGPTPCSTPSESGVCLHECSAATGGSSEFQLKDDQGQAILIFRHHTHP